MNATEVSQGPPALEFENNPFYVGDWAFHRYGTHVVGKGELENGAMYGLFRKSDWTPTGQLSDVLMRSSYLVLKDGSMFEQEPMNFCPKGVRGPKTFPREVEEAWRKLERERIRWVIGQMFPEVLADGAVVSRRGTVFIFKPGSYLDTDDLDTITDYVGDAALEPYLGTAVEHDMHGRTGMLEQSQDGSTFLVKWTRNCMNGDWDEETEKEIPCPHDQEITFYTMSGCHHGAWCYIADPETGKYLADLRNVTVLCDKCAS